MLVVADTSPLNYLVLIGHQDVLPRLFGRVLIPGAVLHELQNVGSSNVVREWAVNHPDWLTVRDPAQIDPLPGLDPGETAAICLAREVRADRLLIDDLDGRRIAGSYGIRVEGTLGVLVDAAVSGLVNLRDAMGRLKATSFRAAPALLDDILLEFERRQ